MGAGSLKQICRAHYIGFHEGNRTLDRAINMRFRREVHDDVGIGLGKHLHKRIEVANVGLIK